MAACIPFCQLIGISIKNLNKKETLYFELDLFNKICCELICILREQPYSYFNLLNYPKEEDEFMVEINFIRSVIKDILITEEYTITGIALYTQTPEEVVFDIAIGANPRPSATFLRKIIELHYQVKRDLYAQIKKKILMEYATNEIAMHIDGSI